MNNPPESEDTTWPPAPTWPVAGENVRLPLTRPLVNFHNPYLAVSPWQPVWTVLVPLAWVAVLNLCPFVRHLYVVPALGRKIRHS